MVIQPLFPVPLASMKMDRPFKPAELRFIEKLERRPNVGNQSSVNTFILNEKPMKNIKLGLQSCVDQYFNNVFAPNENLKLVITQSWANYTLPGSHHHPHSHPNSIVSGVFYVKANKEQDKIRFHTPRISPYQVDSTAFNLFNSSNWTLEAEDTLLFLFPSYLQHDVPTTTGDEERISISFNTFFVGELGKKEELTLLSVKG